jgi:hypothetical protein
MPAAVDLSAATRDFAGSVSEQAPATYAEAVAKSDTINLRYVSRALWVGGTGDVAVEMQSGDVVVFTAVPAGTLLPIRINRVNSTSTTATAMVAIN